MKNFDLVSFGDTVVDFTPAGKTNKGTNLYERNPGGSTSNVACGVSRLGKKVAVMSAVGDDVISSSRTERPIISWSGLLAECLLALGRCSR